MTLAIALIAMFLAGYVVGTEVEERRSRRIRRAVRLTDAQLREAQAQRNTWGTWGSPAANEAVAAIDAKISGRRR